MIQLFITYYKAEFRKGSRVDDNFWADGYFMGKLDSLELPSTSQGEFDLKKMQDNAIPTAVTKHGI